MIAGNLGVAGLGGLDCTAGGSSSSSEFGDGHQMRGLRACKPVVGSMLFELHSSLGCALASHKSRFGSVSRTFNFVKHSTVVRKIETIHKKTDACMLTVFACNC